MNFDLKRYLPQPAMWLGSLALALGALAVSWVLAAPPAVPPGQTLALPAAAALTLAVVLANRFPIHLGPATKVYMGSVALYLMAVLLPPPLAMAAAGVGTLGGEVAARPFTGNGRDLIAAQMARLMLVIQLGSLVAHAFPPASALGPAPLVAAGLVLWAGDIVTAPLVLWPVTRQHPRRIVALVVREAGLAEGCQYLVGLLGALLVLRDVWALVLLFLPTLLVYRTFKRAKEMHEGTRRLLERTADSVDLRDAYTGGHSRRVTEYTEALLTQLGKRGPEVKLIVAAARVHDIGKIGIPDHVLRKEGTLTDEEWAIMQSHPERGAQLLAQYPDFARGVAIVRHHHERWDGRGYPDGLKGTDIPFGARVIAVADSFDAMTSDRPYRAGMLWERAAAILREGRGSQWDAELVDAFVRALAEGLGRSAPRRTAPRGASVPGKVGAG